MLENVPKGIIKVTRNLDGEAGYVNFIDLYEMRVALEEMNLNTNGAENIGAKRKQSGEVDKFVGPMPDVIITSKSENEKMEER